MVTDVTEVGLLAGSEAAPAVEDSLLLAPKTPGAGEPGISQAQACWRGWVRQPVCYDFL